MSEITTAEALNQVRKLKNLFRSFEKMGEIIELVMGMERAVTKAQTEHKALLEGINTAKKELLDLEASRETIGAEIDAEGAESRARHKEAVRVLSDQRKVKEKETDAFLMEMGEKQAAATKAHEDTLNTLYSEIKSLKADKIAHEKDLDSVLKKLSSVRSQLEKVL